MCCGVSDDCGRGRLDAAAGASASAVGTSEVPQSTPGMVYRLDRQALEIKKAAGRIYRRVGEG
jgi:hypothetical protein